MVRDEDDNYPDMYFHFMTTVRRLSADTASI